MRLKQRRKVLLPQPDGPISAVTWCSGITRLMFFSAWLLPYQKLSFSALALAGLARADLRSSITIDSDGVSEPCALVSPCIFAACLGVLTVWMSTIVFIGLTS